LCGKGNLKREPSTEAKFHKKNINIEYSRSFGFKSFLFNFYYKSSFQIPKCLDDYFEIVRRRRIGVLLQNILANFTKENLTTSYPI